MPKGKRAGEKGRRTTSKTPQATGTRLREREARDLKKVEGPLFFAGAHGALRGAAGALLKRGATKTAAKAIAPAAKAIAKKIPKAQPPARIPPKNQPGPVPPKNRKPPFKKVPPKARRKR